MIRAMEEKDLPAVLALENVCFCKAPWDESMIRFELESNPFSRPLVLEQDKTIAGYAILYVMFEQAQLARIAVHPDCRRKGLGKTLLAAVLERAKKEGAEWLSLEVRVGNESARKMYEQAGFSRLHTSKGYYSDGEDALVMGIGI